MFQKTRFEVESGRADIWKMPGFFRVTQTWEVYFRDLWKGFNISDLHLGKGHNRKKLVCLLKFLKIQERKKETSQVLVSLNGTHVGGIKQCKGTVTLRHFPYDSALLGLLI